MRKPVDNLDSKALSANLAVTKPAQIVLTSEAEWLLSVTANHFGIHQRLGELLDEVYHPYMNPSLALKLLRKGILGDLWFFVSLEDSARALRAIFACYLHISEGIKEADEALKLGAEVLEFLSGIAVLEQPDVELLSEILAWLEAEVALRRELYIRHNGVLRKGLLTLPDLGDLQARALVLLKNTFLGSLQFWQNQSSLLPAEISIPFPQDGFWQENITQLNHEASFTTISLIPSYGDIAKRFRENIIHIPEAQQRLDYIFALLKLEGMEELRENLLWDLNRELTGLYKQMPASAIVDVIDTVSDALESFHESHMSIVLDCLSGFGKTIIGAGVKAHVQHFIHRFTLIPFTAPGEVSIGEDWQLHTDKTHIKHLRVYMELIALNPTLCQDLLANLVINVSKHGILISDEDLFQKDVSALLNADIKGVFIQLRHLLRQFPVFYSEIGAEGEIRDLSTEIDDMGQRRDRLIHFLRKQVHTESNNTHIKLCASIMHYWTDLDEAHLEGLIPADVMNYLSSGDAMLKAQQDCVNAFLEEAQLDVDGLLALSWQSLERLFKGKEPDFYLKRLKLLCDIHLLLKDKYGLDPYDIVKFLARYKFFDNKEQNRLRTSLVRRDYDSSIRQLLGYIGRLNGIILNPVPSSGWENIFYKRHIAAGIPSMYGVYREPKLEAMGMVFRIENVLRRLFEYNIKQININYITGKNLRRIVRILELYDLALQQELLTNEAFSSAVQMFEAALSIRNCTISQYLDIVRLLKDSVGEIINEYYYRYYDPELRRRGSAGLDTEMEAEAFYRKLLMGSFMVQGLDVFITNLMETLGGMRQMFSSADLLKLMSYDPDRLFFRLHAGSSHLENQVMMGSKAYFLKKLWRYGFPIPPGFVISTELYRNREIIKTHPDISQEFEQLFKEQVARLERHTGCKLGDADQPLLLSVRSGAPMSLPGAMDTFLNIGLNDEVAQLLSQQPNFGWTAWDSYRRLIQSWGMAYGIARDEFDRVMLAYKKKHVMSQKTHFSSSVMQAMCEDYKAILAAHDIALEQDPMKQLQQAVAHVLDSWNTPRAQMYRRKLNISDDWGTAVIIQKMVMGNISLQSGSGVLFTHADWVEGPGICLNGDFTLSSQGEDVVAGLVHTLPISEEQASHQVRSGETSLEKSFPAIYNRLLRFAKHLILNENYPHQEIEFTFEGPNEDQLYILQTRNQIIRQVPDYPVLDIEAGEAERLGSGIGIGKGALGGLIVISKEDIDRFAAQGKPLILVRPDTVPDDMALLFECQGLLTSRGGVTSHAAVTATRLELTGIVNCWDLLVNEQNSTCRIGRTHLKAGDAITLDASTGSIYLGFQPLKSVKDIM
jgi:pyruvate,orthophosphate dikinase